MGILKKEETSTSKMEDLISHVATDLPELFTTIAKGEDINIENFQTLDYIAFLKNIENLIGPELTNEIEELSHKVLIKLCKK